MARPFFRYPKKLHSGTVSDLPNVNEFQSLLACAAFFYSSLFDLYWHIYILSAGTVLGAACYYAADIMVLKREPAAVDDSPHEDDDVVESHL